MTSVLRRTMVVMLALVLAFAVFAIAMPVARAEGTEEEVVEEPDEVIEEPDEVIEEPDEVEPEPEPEPEPTAAPIVKTGDATANLAIIAAATAIVAAAGMSFVLKKVR